MSIENKILLYTTPQGNTKHNYKMGHKCDFIFCQENDPSTKYYTTS